MQWLVRGLEAIAGTFLALVMAITFVSVIFRYGFNSPIPDSFDLGRLALGVVVFWGIATAGYTNEHIKVDIVWAAASSPWRRAIDLFAVGVTLAVMAVLAWTCCVKLVHTYGSGEQTFDLRLPLWPFYALAWLGLVAAVMLLAVRARLLYRVTGSTSDPAFPASG